MQDIADVLEIKAASLYNHIGSKQEILSELLLNIANAFTSGMLEIKSSSLDNMEKLEALVDLHLSLTLQYRDSIALITGEWVHLEEPELSNYKKHREAYEQDFMSILKACQKDGLIHAKTNLE